MTKELQKKILELRKELREDYEKRVYQALLSIDSFLERLQEGAKGIPEDDNNK